MKRRYETLRTRIRIKQVGVIDHQPRIRGDGDLLDDRSLDGARGFELRPIRPNSRLDHPKIDRQNLLLTTSTDLLRMLEILLKPA